MVDASIRKRMNLFFKKVSYINDEGFVFQEDKIQNYFMFDKLDTDFTMDSSDYIFEILVYSGADTQMMTRKYQKIQEICATLGGLGHVLIFFGFLLVMNQKEFTLNKSLINSLYSFPQKTPMAESRNLPPKLDLVKNFSDLSAGGGSVLSVQETTTQRKPLERKGTKTKKSKHHKTFQKVDISQIELTMSQNQKNFIQPKTLVDDQPPSMSSIEREIPAPKDECKKINDSISRGINDGFPHVSSKIEESGKIGKDSPKNSRKGSVSTPQGGSPKNKRNIFFKKVKKGELEIFENFAEYQQIENEKHLLSISFSEFIKLRLGSLCRCLRRSNNQKLYLKAEERVSKEMDFLFILQKLQDIEKMKLVLLSPHQIHLFNLLSKPMIFEEESVSEEVKSKDGFKMSMILNKNLNDKGTMREVMEYYKSLKEGKKSDVDDRLLALVERSLDEFSKAYKHNANENV